ncbi:hypothetical protein V5O48_003224 [Marasmius crinis-equi]|uniref:Polymerase nucleotidyl transferase domain-containing protein n=1 Tax=Marasmius crinis-equi TaxID=585013 RepID=A0ABR3FUH4_9AGAR
MPRRARGPTSSQEVRKAVRAAVAALAANRIRSCVFGSAACQIYGMNNRIPEDVDIVLLTNDGRDVEDIKVLVVETDDNFYLVPSTNPRATYQKLFYLLPGRRSCKVDILLPGRATDLNIPVIPRDEVEYIDPYGDIPVMPFIPLLLMKLQGWIDHREAVESHKRAKVPRDVTDLFQLLRLAVDSYEFDLSHADWLPYHFLETAGERVEVFVEKHPESTTYWREIGFDI